MRCCIGCSRILLILLSVLFLLVGFALACLVLWLRFDDQFEQQLRQTLLSDPSMVPPELAETKSGFRQAYFAIFWALTALGLLLAFIGFFGICGACTQSRPVNVFLCVFLVLLILLQLLVFLAIALYRNLVSFSWPIPRQFHNYMSTSFQYNLQDASVIQNRFGCCGDGNSQASYNYQCTAFGQPNCRQMLEQWFSTILAGIGISMAALVALELLALILSAVLICNRKYDPRVEDIH